MPFYRVILEEKIQHELTVEAADEASAMELAFSELESGDEEIESEWAGISAILVQDEESF